jgi:hypothetical protein
MLKFLLCAWQAYEAYFIAVFVVGGIYIASKMIQAQPKDPYPDEDEWGPS